VENVISIDKDRVLATLHLLSHAFTRDCSLHELYFYVGTLSYACYVYYIPCVLAKGEHLINFGRLIFVPTVNILYIARKPKRKVIGVNLL